MALRLPREALHGGGRPPTLVSLVAELFARRHALIFGIDVAFRINADMLGLARLPVRRG